MPAPSWATGASCPRIPLSFAANSRSGSLELLGAFVPVALADEASHDDGIEVAVRTARLMRDAGARDAFIVLSDDNGLVAEREQHAGRITRA